jgi:hypothetical protein
MASFTSGRNTNLWNIRVERGDSQSSSIVGASRLNPSRELPGMPIFRMDRCLIRITTPDPELPRI